LTGILVVFTTFDKAEDARRMARSLLQKRLSACIQILGPIRSFYRWKGKEEEAEEWLCLIKTTQELYPELEAVILEQHPYETPEIVALPVVRGSRGYLEWVRQEVDIRGKLG